MGSEEVKCCCEAHDIGAVDEMGDKDEKEVPDGHGVAYRGMVEGSCSEMKRGRFCPSCPVHGIDADGVFKRILMCPNCDNRFLSRNGDKVFCSKCGYEREVVK